MCYNWDASEQYLRSIIETDYIQKNYLYKYNIKIPQR